ncbi:hypothetical protein L2U69_03960 [Zavarzinia compransoris]|uniref:hypothetical protein n=1 Tax=Zavarzinia marina TaxID=2911065 RepID=UPI001F2EF939|nr:hypothetical protein [Zavarzinia marina]MCF4164793.1 hypothetical protein [Zavarzinia marina]
MSTRAMSGRLSSRNWFGKSAAGLVLGYGIAIACSGLIALAGPMADNGKMQFVMWMVPPVWCGVLGFCFLFRDGWRAWGWLGLANILLFGAFFAGRALLH